MSPKDNFIKNLVGTISFFFDCGEKKISMDLIWKYIRKKGKSIKKTPYQKKVEHKKYYCSKRK